jgi:hypothetical protein
MRNYDIHCEENVKRLDQLQDFMYGHLSRFELTFNRSILFTDSGASRLASIAGYILAMRHNGQEDFALRMVADLHARFDQLGNGHENIEIAALTTEDQTVSIKVPPRKVVLHDDGCLHSFSFVSFFAVAPERFDECVQKHRVELEKLEQAGSRHYETPQERAIKELQILERVNPHEPYKNLLTENRAVNGRVLYVHYCRGFNGGLIYHGPGSGETFSVSLDTSGALWSVHT